MASPISSPSPPPATQLSEPQQQPPPVAATAATPNPKPISTWTHHETINLIQAYQDKWYSLKRGQLKASQWEEVAVTVAAKCGYDYSHPSAKSAIQCRHKMEKLRKRYRTEKQGGGGGATTRWPYFPLMDAMDRGPLPLSSARPMTHISYRDDYVSGGDKAVEDNDDDDDDDDDDEENYSKSRSINYILRRPTLVNRFSSGASYKRPRLEAEENRGGYLKEEMGSEMVATEIRRFSERLMRMEKKKIDMVKEMERLRMEMENRRIQLILDSQRKLVDIIHLAFQCDDDHHK